MSSYTPTVAVLGAKCLTLMEGTLDVRNVSVVTHVNSFLG